MPHLWTVPHNTCLEIQSQLQPVQTNIVYLDDNAVCLQISYSFIKLAHYHYEEEIVYKNFIFKMKVNKFNICPFL